MNIPATAKVFRQVLRLRSPVVMSVASVHSSASNLAGQEWRRERLKPLNINRYGAFADLPDYTYLDGRRTPPGPNKVRRALKQQEYAEKIMQYTSEIDFAVNRQDRLRKEEHAQRKDKLARKLKPKGQKYV